MKRTASTLLIVLLALSITAQAGDTKKKKPSPPKEQTREVTVYVTNTGTKYHTEGCRSLRKSSIPMKLSDAKKSYSPCSICHPPE